MSVLHIENILQFDQEVLQHQGVAVVDFYADWCMPCKMQAPILDDLAKECDDLVIAKVNIDDIGELAQRYSIQTIPTIMIVHDGKIVSQVAGVQTKDALKKMVDHATN